MPRNGDGEWAAQRILRTLPVIFGNAGNNRVRLREPAAADRDQAFHVAVGVFSLPELQHALDGGGSFVVALLVPVPEREIVPERRPQRIELDRLFLGREILFRIIENVREIGLRVQHQHLVRVCRLQLAEEIQRFFPAPLVQTDTEEAGQRDHIGRLEIERLLPGGFRRRECRRLVVPFIELVIRIPKERVPFGEIRRFFGCVAQERRGAGEVLFVAAVYEILGFEIHAVGIAIDRLGLCARSATIRLAAAQRPLQRRGNGIGDIGLYRKDVGQIALVRLRPQLEPVAGVDKLDEDAHAVAGLAHAAFEQVLHMEGAGDRLRVEIFALEGEGRAARGDAQGSPRGERIQELVGNAVGEIVVRARGEVGEGQDGKRIRGGVGGGCELRRREGRARARPECPHDADAEHGGTRTERRQHMPIGARGPERAARFGAHPLRPGADEYDRQAEERGKDGELQHPRRPLIGGCGDRGGLHHHPGGDGIGDGDAIEPLGPRRLEEITHYGSPLRWRGV